MLTVIEKIILCKKLQTTLTVIRSKNTLVWKCVDVSLVTVIHTERIKHLALYFSVASTFLPPLVLLSLFSPSPSPSQFPPVLITRPPPVKYLQLKNIDTNITLLFSY